MAMTTYQRVSDQQSAGINQQLILSNQPVNGKRSVQTADGKEMHMVVWQKHYMNAARQHHTETVQTIFLNKTASNMYIPCDQASCVYILLEKGGLSWWHV